MVTLVDKNDVCFNQSRPVGLHEAQINDPKSILNEYKDLTVGIGCLKIDHEIKLKPNSQPVIHAPRKVPFLLRDKLKCKLDELVNQNIIEKVDRPTEWVNSLVIVNKPNGDIRLCIDPQDLNKCIMRQHYPLPSFDDISNKLSGATVFSTIDTKNAFWHIKLTDRSADLCTFNTPFGRYRFLRLPYGLCSSSEIFSQRMREMLENIEGVDVFVDDIIVWGKDVNEHNKRLRAVLDKLRAENVKLSVDKCNIGITEIKFLGHKLSKDGISLDENKLTAIANMKAPHDKKSLERFLGLINYVSKFIPNVSDKTAPLRAILKKHADFQWSHEQQTAFDNLKSVLMQRPILQFFDPKKPIVISVDSSKDGIGAVLLQNSHPIAYASKALNDTEKLYAQIEKEFLAVLYGCEKFHQYIYGSQSVQVETDHKPLISIFKKSIESCPARLQRMMIRLQKYKFELVYKRGKELFIADALSRSYGETSDLNLPNLETEEIEAQIHAVINYSNVSEGQLVKLRNETKNDVELSTLKKYISKWPSDKSKLPNNVKCYWSVRNELSCTNDLILKGRAIVIPNSMRHEMLNRLHYSHCGITKTFLRAKDVLYWPNITKDICNLISKCEPCILYSKSNRKEPLIPHSVPDLPWQKVAIDLFELGNKDYMLVTDYFSKYPELVSLPSISAESVVSGLKPIFSRHGIPSTVMTDAGTQFTCKYFKDFASLWMFDHVTSSPHYHQSNGMVERAIQTVKYLLKKAHMDKKDIYLALLEYRNTPLDANLPSPAEILFSRKLRGMLPMCNNSLKPKVMSKVKKCLVDKQARQKSYYDRQTRHLRPLKTNELVLFKTFNNSWAKGHIVKPHIHPRTYVVQSEQTGKLFIRNRFNLKPLNMFVCNTPSLNDEEDDVDCKPNRPNELTNTTEIVPVPVTTSPVRTHENVNRPNIDTKNVTRSGRVVKPIQKMNL